MASIYHYTKFGTFLNKILPSGKIKTSHLDVMNDPREIVEWSFGSKNLPLEKLYEDYSTKNHIKCQYRFGKMVKDVFQVICFSGAKKNGWDNEMMWAHYGEVHRGVCLEFDEDLLLENIKVLQLKANFVLENVDYHNKSEKDWFNFTTPENFQLDFMSNIESMYKYLCLTKSHFWEKEDEKRLVFIHASDEIFIPFGNSLKAIHTGIKFPLELIPSLYKELANESIELFSLNYQRNKFDRWPVGTREIERLKSFLAKKL